MTFEFQYGRPAPEAGKTIFVTDRQTGGRFKAENTGDGMIHITPEPFETSAPDPHQWIKAPLIHG